MQLQNRQRRAWTKYRYVPGIFCALSPFSPQTWNLLGKIMNGSVGQRLSQWWDRARAPATPRRPLFPPPPHTQEMRARQHALRARGDSLALVLVNPPGETPLKAGDWVFVLRRPAPAPAPAGCSVPAPPNQIFAAANRAGGNGEDGGLAAAVAQSHVTPPPSIVVMKEANENDLVEG